MEEDTSTQDASTDQSQENRKRVVKRKKKSWAWEYFVEEESSSVVRILNCQIAGCKVPKIELKKGNYSTNPMLNHLKVEHRLLPVREEDTEEEKGNKKARLGSMELHINKKEQDRLDALVGKFIASSHSSFNMVENIDFIELVEALSPNYKLPSRFKVRSIIIEEAEKLKEHIKIQSKKSDHISFCVDLWKSNARDYYVAVTIQFIDGNWSLCNVPVGFRQILGRHSAEAVGNLVADIISPFLGEHKFPFAAVVDGGDIASAKFTARKLGCEGQLRDNTCICHILNNIIKRILNDYLQESVLSFIRKFVTHLHHSNPFYELWAECCVNCLGKEVEMQMDTATRWSSTLALLEKFTLVLPAVERIYHLCSSEDYKDHQEYVPYYGVPDNETEVFLKHIVELFHPTIEAISTLEGQNYITQSLILLQMSLLERNVLEIKNKYPKLNNKQLHVVLEDLKKELENLWNNLPIDTVIACTLDPRTKYYTKIPKSELKEALKIMQQEFQVLMREEDELEPENRTQKSFMNGLFDDLLNSNERKISPNQHWKTEIDTYQNLPRPLPDADPLLWWKIHETQLPGLAKLVKGYLAIPASQASCERLFSITKNDITENRTSLKPDIVESVLFVGKKREIIKLLSNS
jgi:hypothetical protein